MEVTIRRSDDNKWGFVETYNVYQTIDIGNIKAVLAITPEGKFSTPYVMRDGAFLPLKQIDEEMGISKYIKAKKPFYSLLGDGFIVFLKAGVNFTEKKYLPEGSDFVVYQVVRKDMETSAKGKLHLKRVLEVPDNVKELLTKLSEDLAMSCGDREEFLRSRL